MLLNIITPCTRPSNLHKIAESINIPPDQYRWIVVFDKPEVPKGVPANTECYAHQDGNSRYGNAQRNYALDLVKEGFIYFNDDDTTLHPYLWDNIKYLTNDFISFKQAFSNGKIRLEGKNISVGVIDSHNFVIHYSILGNTRWVLNRYDADGLFAYNCKKKSNLPIYIPRVLSIYNSLRN